MEPASEFASNGTPLSRETLKDLIPTFCQRFTPERRKWLPFSNCRPSCKYVQNSLQGKNSVSFRSRRKLEKSRQFLMAPKNMAVHCARLHQVYQNYGVKRAEQFLNVDKSGFSVRTGHRARAKEIFISNTRCHSVDVK